MADTVETRYARTDQGASGQWALSTTQGASAALQIGPVWDLSTNPFYYNADIILKHTGSEDTLGSAVAETSRTVLGSGMQSATWACPATALVDTDKVKMILRAKQGTATGTDGFLTDAVSAWAGADKGALKAATWTIYRYTYAQDNAGDWEGGIKWGNASFDTRITNFTYGANDVNITVADTAAGTDAVSVPAIGLVVDDTVTGADMLSLPFPMPDTASGSDAVAVEVYIVIAEAATGNDNAGLATKELSIDDTLTGADAASVFLGDLYPISETATGSDGVAVTTLITVSDTATGLDSIAISGNTAVLLLVCLGFPSGQAVEYQIEDGDGNLIQDWTSGGVFEKVVGNKSTYRVWREKLTNAIVNWRIPGTAYEAAEVINIYTSYNDVPASSLATNSQAQAIYNETQTPTVLAKEETLSRLLGLCLENHVEDDIVRDANGNKTQSKLYLYDSAAHATAHTPGGGGSTGLVAKYEANFTYDANGKMTLNKVTRLV